MKATIDIEQFDNGITIHSEDDCGNIGACVVYDVDKEKSLGKMLWQYIKYTMDSELTNKVRVKIEYEPIKDK